jgi:hypothetical protein
LSQPRRQRQGSDALPSVLAQGLTALTFISYSSSEAWGGGCKDKIHADQCYTSAAPTKQHAR